MRLSNRYNITALQAQSNCSQCQPPYRPAPAVFGPVWTMLYAAMGYAAHRAWTTGMSSSDAHRIALTKVRSLETSSSGKLTMIAWSNTLHGSAWAQLDLDAIVLQIRSSN